DAAAPAPPAVAPVAEPQRGADVAPGEPSTAERRTAAVPEAELVTITAPVVGVFYRAPEPGAAPFTDVDAHVEEGSTLGLVEVMKMFTSVTASVSGRVVDVLAANEEFVEFGQPLMTIRPETA
ncbi:MAG: acetyl-CoA carboxylase biotin carboxyl carrier protein, partial [Actinomycetes bacterium]